MVKKLYEVRNRSGDLILENATSGEIRETLHCTTAQVNNARTSGDHIFGEYEVKEVDRKLSRKADFDLLREFESVCVKFYGYVHIKLLLLFLYDILKISSFTKDKF